MLRRPSFVGGSLGKIIMASQRLNPCLDLEADIVAVEAAAVASTSDDWSLPLGSGGLRVSSSNVDVDGSGVIRLARMGSPTPIFSNVLSSTIKHDFSDGGSVQPWGAVTPSGPSMELLLDFWPDPSIFTAPMTLSGLTLQIGIQYGGVGTFNGTFPVQFYQFDRDWNRQPVGSPVISDVVATFAPGGLNTYTFDFHSLNRNFIFEPGRFPATRTGSGRDSSGVLRTVNQDETGASQIIVNKGFSLGIRVSNVLGAQAYLAATDNSLLANFDQSAFWRAIAAPGTRAHGPYDPAALYYHFGPLNTNHDTDGFLNTGAVPGYGAKAVASGFVGYSKRVALADADRVAITQPWAVPYHQLTIDTYWKTGTEVIVLDLLSTPVNGVEVRADDVIPSNSSVTYSLRGSNTSNAGPWTAVGTVVDGQVLTGTLYRWYEVTITLSSTGSAGTQTVLASDSCGRADSSSSMGTADIGGAWNPRVGTWGITSAKGYCVSNANTQIATIGTVSTPGEVGADLATDAIQNHVNGLVPLWVDINNCLLVQYYQGALTLFTRVAGTQTARVTLTPAAAGLNATGTDAFNASCAVDPTTFLVTLKINGAVVSNSYTLSAGEIAAFASAVNAGVFLSWVSGTNTACTFDNFYAKLAGVANGAPYATPQVQAFTLTARTRYATARYDADLDATSTIDPITGDAGIGDLSLSLLKLTRDQRDLPTFLASNYSPANIEARIYAVNRITGDRWFVNSYRLEGRTPSDIDEAFSFVSGLDRLKVNVPPESETYSGGVFTISGTSVTGTDRQFTFSGTPAMPTVTPNTVPGVNYQGVQGYRLYVITSVVAGMAGRSFPIITSRSTTVSSLWITPRTTGAADAPAVGDTVEVHSDVYHRADVVYSNTDFAAIYSDVLESQAQVPSRYRGTQPGTTGRVTTATIANAPRLQGTNPRAALDVLKELALHCGGCLSWDQGRINFVPIYDDMEAVAFWDERHYVTLDTPQGADRRMPRIYSKYNFDYTQNSFQNESRYTDLDAFYGFGLANLFDVTELDDSLCAWNDVDEAQFLANQFLQACSTGVRLWKVTLALPYPWIQFGDAVMIATNQYTDHSPRYIDGTGTVDSGLSISGRTYAVGRVVGKNLWGTEFLVFVPGLKAIASSTVTVGTQGGPYDDIPTPADLAFTPEVRGDASAPVSSILATYTRPDNPYFARMVYSIQVRRTGDTSYGAVQIVTGDRLGQDRIPVSPGTELMVTPITMTTAEHAFAGTPVSVVVPAFAPPTPTITATAGASTITYNFTLDPATKYAEVWDRTYADGSQPGSAPNQWNASGASKVDTLRTGDSRTTITRPVGTGTEWDSVTFVPFDANNLPGTPLSFLTKKTASPLPPSAPTAASNTSVTSSTVTNSVTMPASITHFDVIRVYKDGAVFGSDITRTAGASSAQTVVHSGLSPSTTDGWRYSGVNSTTGDESSLTTSFNATTSAASIPTPSISVSYSAGADAFNVSVAPAGGSPAGVTWHLKHATSSGGTYTEDAGAASTSTSLVTDAGFVSNNAFGYIKIWGVKTGYANSADAGPGSAKRVTGGL